MYELNLKPIKAQTFTGAIFTSSTIGEYYVAIFEDGEYTLKENLGKSIKEEQAQKTAKKIVKEYKKENQIVGPLSLYEDVYEELTYYIETLGIFWNELSEIYESNSVEDE